MQKALIIACMVVLLLAASALLYIKFVLVPELETGRPLSRVQEEALWETPDFDLVNCDGRSISKADLLGKVWAAAFIFTRCPGPCPLIAQRMAEAQRRLQGIEDFRLVSFTVDPGYDTPEVLLRYAQERRADPRRWYFLTGRDPRDDVMHQLANQFKVAAARTPSEGEDQPEAIPDIVHGTNILLVDQKGWVRAVLDSEDPQSGQFIAEGVRQLLAAP